MEYQLFQLFRITRVRLSYAVNRVFCSELYAPEQKIPRCIFSRSFIQNHSSVFNLEYVERGRFPKRQRVDEVSRDVCAFAWKKVGREVDKTPVVLDVWCVCVCVCVCVRENKLRREEMSYWLVIEIEIKRKKYTRVHFDGIGYFWNIVFLLPICMSKMFPHALRPEYIY